jgi:RsiW-degrading membrane proteinase PrsW (M82 family)
MDAILIISAALLPAILLFLYIWKKDPQKEPTSQLLKGVLFGALIIIPVGIVEYIIQMILFGGGEPSSLLGTTALAFLVAAVPEECFKLLALWLLVRRNPYFDEHIDGIVYAVCVGLGFAAVENIGYLFGNSEEWVAVAITRSLLAVPGHYAFAVIMGYYYSLYHFVERSQTNRRNILLMPILAHGIYDALAMTGMVSPIVGGICFFVLIWFCIKMHKFAYKKMLVHLKNDEEKSVQYSSVIEQWMHYTNYKG